MKPGSVCDPDGAVASQLEPDDAGAAEAAQAGYETALAVSEGRGCGDCDPSVAATEWPRSGRPPRTSYPLEVTVHGIGAGSTDVRVTSFRINPDRPQAGQVGILGTFRCELAGLVILKGCTLHQGLDGIRVSPPNGHRVMFITGTLRRRLARRAHAAFRIAVSEQASEPAVRAEGGKA
jgi:hypothetical protein